MTAAVGGSLVVRTWADSDGRWHASVPHTTRAAAVARAAIAAELTARAPRGVRVVVTVERERWAPAPGHTLRPVYREVSAREVTR